LDVQTWRNGYEVFGGDGAPSFDEDGFLEILGQNGLEFMLMFIEVVEACS
jgi:hypothetical protein